MDHREIILQMEERKYDALRRALLARDTDPRAEMQEWLNVCYRELVPQQERELIEKQINEERQPGLSEAGTQPKFNVFRVIERGECHCFQVNDASVDALEIANRLYGYLSRETVGFAEQFEGWTSLTECRFIDQMMRCLCEDERVAGAFHIDLDTGTFSALDPENGCQRQSKIVRKRRTNFVVFRRWGGNKIRCFLAQKECSQFAASGA